ncbi:MAG: hypothetical protein IGS38_07890 [Synechococcales cyanobacterium M58_A2018_015]|nr:hypothetical protein [Synechococcales cyanobacterium M58_A2018_015]
MAFIKVENVVINTSYIAAVRLEGHNSAGEETVSLLIAIPMFPLFSQELTTTNLYHYEWLEFAGDSATALKDYFSSFNHVTDLLPSQSSSLPQPNFHPRRD